MSQAVDMSVSHDNTHTRKPRRTRARTLLQLILLPLLLTLFNCGGGGGGGGGTTPTEFSGVVRATTVSVTDSDSNDAALTPVRNNPSSSAPYAAADLLASAQTIPSPSLVGGYVNQPGTGPDGPLKTSGDSADIYRVALNTGDQVRLTQKESTNTANLDLCWYDENGTLINCSQNATLTETFTVPASAIYLLEVRCSSGFSTYLLDLANSSGNVGTSNTDDFVPGEIIIGFRDSSNSSTSSSSTSSSTSSTTARSSTSQLSENAGLALIKTLNRNGTLRQFRLPSNNNSRAASLRALTNSNNAAASNDLKQDTLNAIAALRQRSDIAFAEPNYIRRMQFAPNDEHYALQWQLPQLNLPAAWDITRGSNVTVAVLDTGILGQHPDLSGQYWPGYDFVSSSDSDGDSTPGRDDDPGDPGILMPNNTLGYHGTHVAGIIAATSNNSIGISGIAPNSKLLPLRVIGKNGGTSIDIMEALQYAANLHPTLTNPHPAQIVNMSFGGTAYSLAEQNIIASIRAEGVILVAAAGNIKTTEPITIPYETAFYPASYEGVISVGATNQLKQRPAYSNYGNTLDLMAPGGDISSADANGILSTWGESTGSLNLTYQYLQGTSMATAHVSAIIALMRSVAGSKLTPWALEAALPDIVEDLGTAGRDDNYGYGLIDALKAVQKAQQIATLPENTSIPANLSVSTTMLNFGATTSAMKFILRNTGTETLLVNSVTADQAWLSIENNNIINGLGDYYITINRAALTSGLLYKATITINSNVGSKTLPVYVYVPNGSYQPDAGYLHILVLDKTSEPSQIVARFTGSTLSTGQLAFSTGSLSTGRRYELYAGSDLDNNGKICELGESCGAAGGLASPTRFSSSSSNLSISTGYGASLGITR